MDYLYGELNQNLINLANYKGLDNGDARVLVDNTERTIGVDLGGLKDSIAGSYARIGFENRFTGSNVFDGSVITNGTLQLDGGIKPIHTYKLDGITTLYVIFEDVDHDGSMPNDFMGYGWIERFGNGRPCIFYYALQDGKVSVFRGLSSDTIYEYRDNRMQTFSIAKASECQPKLYRHMITLMGGNSADSTCRLEWISSNNLECDSLEDLRTVLGNPQMQSYVASNPSGDLFGVVISPSTAQLKKVGTTSLVDITSVSDTVTPL